MTTQAGALKPYIEVAAGRRDLTEAEAEAAFEIIMSGAATPAQIAGFLMALRTKGESVSEVTGAARIMRAKALTVRAPDGAVDCCGTGGDGVGTINVSTAVSFVLAGCGVPVAKHGNRAASSRSGAADVLRALGVNIEAEPTAIERALAEAGVCFLFAQRHHSAMRHVMPTRVELGVRTIFNVLGPLSNPAGARRQLVGVFAPHWVETLATVLGRLGAEKAWVVHGADGLDEVSTTGPTRVAQWAEGQVTTFEVTPEDAGVPRGSVDDIRGGDADANARALRAILDGATGPHRDIVLLNAAAALIVADRASTLREGAEQAAHSIDSGAARGALEALARITTAGAVAS